MNKAFRWIVLLLFFLLGAGCFVLYFNMSSDDAGTEGKQAVTGTLLTGTVPLGKLTVLSDGSLAAGNSRGEVVFLHPGQKPQTVYVTPTSISAPVTESDGVYYVGDEGGTFAAFTPDKGVLWTFRAGNQITGAAIPAGDLVWFGSHDNSLYALGVSGDDSGKVIHEVECRGQINGTPLFYDGFVIFGSCDGKLRKTDMKTGEVVQALDFDSYIPESPVLYGGVLYLLTHGGDLAAVDPNEFKVIYRVETGFQFFSSPFVTDEFIYLTDANGKIHVHKRADGSFVADLPSAKTWNPISSGTENGVYALSRHGNLSFFEAGSWKEHVIAEFPSDFRTGVIAAHGFLAAADEYGNIFYAERKDEP